MADATRVETLKRLRVLFFEERGRWHAVSLEHYLLVEARTFGEAKRSFEKALDSYVRTCMELGTEPFVELPAAPSRYGAMFEAAELAPREQLALALAQASVELEARACA